MTCHVTSSLQLKPEMVDLVYDCAKFKYECGNYTDASEYLYFYKVLVRALMALKILCAINVNSKSVCFRLFVG